MMDRCGTLAIIITVFTVALNNKRIWRIMKDVRWITKIITQQKETEEKPTFVQVKIFLTQATQPFVSYISLARCNRSISFARNFSVHGFVLSYIASTKMILIASTGMILRYLAVIVSVQTRNSASYLNAETKFIISYYLRDYKQQC